MPQSISIFGFLHVQYLFSIGYKWKCQNMKWGKKQLTTVSYILTTVKVVTKATKALQIILALNLKVFTNS